MTTKPTAMILGGTVPHIDLIENLKKRNYYTLLIDYYENPAAKQFADEHIQASTLDIEAVYQLAKNRQVKLVITSCIDQANLTACYVAEKLNLPHPYSFDVAKTVTNKVLMKSIMIKYDIPTSKFFIVKNLSEQKLENIKFPVMVKPSDSNSSKGVRKASNYEELEHFVNYAIQISRSNEAIVEEYIEGREFGFDCFIKNGVTNILMSRERIKINKNTNHHQQIYGSIWPGSLTESQYQQIVEIGNKIAKAFYLTNTPLLIQTIINKKNINVIECAARVGGGENFRIIKMMTGVDIIDLSINSFLGYDVDLNFHKPEIFYGDSYIYTKAGIFNKIIGYQHLLEDGTIEHMVTLKTRGSLIGQELSSNNRVGAFIVKSTEKNEILTKIKKALASIDVIDIDGNSIMRKDIY